MQGQILQLDAATGGGTILGADGNRYSFSRNDWKGVAPPSAGEAIDFVAGSGVALDIFPLPAGFASASFSSAAASAATAGAATPRAPDPVPQPPRSSAGQAAPQPASSEGSSVALGVIGILCLILGFVVPLLPTVAAFIVGLIGADSAKRHNNDTGLILSRISWIGALVFLVIGFILLMLAMMFAWPLLDLMWQIMLQIASDEQAQRAVLGG